MKPTIILDIDGVLADFVWGFTNLSHRMFGLPVQPYGNGGQPDWNFRNGTGLIGKQINEIWEHIKASPDFWYMLPLLVTPTDRTLLCNLRDKGFEIRYLTGRLGIGPEKQTADWLWDHNFPCRENLTVLHGGSKALHLGDYPDYYAKEQRAARILEDKPAEVADLAHAGWPVYVRDWPYNRSAGSPGRRVSSVSEFLCAVMREDG